MNKLEIEAVALADKIITKQEVATNICDRIMSMPEAQFLRCQEKFKELVVVADERSLLIKQLKYYDRHSEEFSNLIDQIIVLGKKILTIQDENNKLLSM